nr:hypothetical protein CFP56_13089 [Quercus suber]
MGLIRAALPASLGTGRESILCREMPVHGSDANIEHSTQYFRRARSEHASFGELRVTGHSSLRSFRFVFTNALVCRENRQAQQDWCDPNNTLDGFNSTRMAVIRRARIAQRHR